MRQILSNKIIVIKLFLRRSKLNASFYYNISCIKFEFFKKIKFGLDQYYNTSILELNFPRFPFFESKELVRISIESQKRGLIVRLIFRIFIVIVQRVRPTLFNQVRVIAYLKLTTSKTYSLLVRDSVYRIAGCFHGKLVVITQ